MYGELKKFLRMTVVGTLMFLCLMCLAADPVSEENWLKLFVISKAVAFALGFAGYRLYVYWNKRGLLPQTDDEDGGN